MQSFITTSKPASFAFWPASLWMTWSCIQIAFAPIAIAESTIDGTYSGVSLTQKSVSNYLGLVGDYILIFSVSTFTLSTMFGYSYYGCKCASYLFGANSKFYYRIFYVLTLVLGSVLSLDLAVNIVDAMFALMAFPTMISALYLAPNIKKEANKYFASIADNQ